MKTTLRVSYLERLFTRSCLETSVAFSRMSRFSTSAGAASRDRTHTQLHQLKRQLLRAALEATPQAHLFKRLCGAANQAADEAWNTSLPLLVFPCLFDELATAARQSSLPIELDSTPPLTTAFELSRPALTTSAA